ncbi:nucleophile aminohydrolase [Scenedesmus sp. NREL 46B-D3]|nr:nucleophile aminohydrolase [Scenedesmus sp. NREL 46B-D3]
MSVVAQPGVRQLLLKSLALGHVQAAQTGWLCAAGQQHTRQVSWSRLLQGPMHQDGTWQFTLNQQQQQQQQQCTLWSWSLQHSRQQQQSSSSSRGMTSWSGMEDRQRHSTTILCVRRGPEVVIIGDGQATQNDFIVKPNVRKVRRIGPSAVGGFAGVAVDGLALLEKLEAKLEEHPGQLLRASVELAKMWRQDKLLRELDASLIVADAQTTLWLMGNGDVLEAGADGVIGIGSGSDFAESAARALLQLHSEAQQQQQQKPQQQQQQRQSSSSSDAEPAAANTASTSAAGAAAAEAEAAAAAQAIRSMSLFDAAKKAMSIAADCCVYTNANFSWHHIQPDGNIVSGDSASAAAATVSEA